MNDLFKFVGIRSAARKHKNRWRASNTIGHFQTTFWTILERQNCWQVRERRACWKHYLPFSQSLSRKLSKLLLFIRHNKLVGMVDVCLQIAVFLFIGDILPRKICPCAVCVHVLGCFHRLVFFCAFHFIWLVCVRRTNINSEIASAWKLSTRKRNHNGWVRYCFTPFFFFFCICRQRQKEIICTIFVRRRNDEDEKKHRFDLLNSTRWTTLAMVFVHSRYLGSFDLPVSRCALTVHDLKSIVFVFLCVCSVCLQPAAAGGCGSLHISSTLLHGMQPENGLNKCTMARTYRRYTFNQITIYLFLNAH